MDWIQSTKCHRAEISNGIIYTESVTTVMALIKGEVRETKFENGIKNFCLSPPYFFSKLCFGAWTSSIIETITEIIETKID